MRDEKEKSPHSRWTRDQNCCGRDVRPTGGRGTCVVVCSSRAWHLNSFKGHVVGAFVGYLVSDMERGLNRVARSLGERARR